MMIRILATTTLLTLAMGGSPLYAANARDVVASKYDTKVQTKTGSCVRTRWQASNDACGIKRDVPPPVPYVAPTPKPVAQAPVPRTVIKQEARTIYFNSGSSVLTPGGEKKLDQLAQTLIGAKDIQRVEIVGFADPMGNAKSNQLLSERRAAVVEAYLNERGYVKTGLAKTKAVGDTQASAPCSAKMKRAKKIDCLVTDRKVEVQAVYAEQQ